MMRSLVNKALLATLFLGTVWRADAGLINIDIFVSVGPSLDSSNLQSYLNNAESAIQGGQSTAGTQGTASYYSQANGSVQGGCFITTDQFTSWCGQAPPPDAYAGELGNAVYLGLAITETDGSTFDMQDVQLSGDFGNFTLGSDAGGFTGLMTTFSSNTVGFNNATEFSTSSGAGTDDAQQLTALYTSGIAVDLAFTGATPETSFCTGGVCGDLNFWAENPNGVLGNYSFTVGALGNTGTNPTESLDLITPEPTAFILLLAGLGLLWFRRRSLQWLS